MNKRSKQRSLPVRGGWVGGGGDRRSEGALEGSEEPLGVQGVFGSLWSLGGVLGVLGGLEGLEGGSVKVSEPLNQALWSSSSQRNLPVRFQQFCLRKSVSQGQANSLGSDQGLSQKLRCIFHLHPNSYICTQFQLYRLNFTFNSHHQLFPAVNIC